MLRSGAQQVLTSNIIILCNPSYTFQNLFQFSPKVVLFALMCISITNLLITVIICVLFQFTLMNVIFNFDCNCFNLNSLLTWTWTGVSNVAKERSLLQILWTIATDPSGNVTTADSPQRWRQFKASFNVRTDLQSHCFWSFMISLNRLDFHILETNLNYSDLSFRYLFNQGLKSVGF